MRIGLFKTGCVLFVASLGACTTTPHCESLGKCGGDFLAAKSNLSADPNNQVLSQEWVTTSVDACIENVPNPPDPPSLALIPPRPAGTRAVEPSTIDWCAGLVLSGDGTVKAFDDGWYETLKKYNGWFPSIPLYSGQLEVMDNNQYTLTTTQLASQHFDLSKTCLVAQGVVLHEDPSTECKLVGEQIQVFVSKRLSGLMGLTAAAYANKDADKNDLPICLALTDGGCSCDYNVSLATTASGPWAADNGKLTFFDAQAAPPAEADYCLSAGTLQLSGSKGTDLFNRASLKTLMLRAPGDSK